MRQSRAFRDSEHEIQILNRHAGGAFAEIVQARHQNDVAGLMRQDAQGNAIGVVELLRIEAGFVSLAGVGERFDLDESVLCRNARPMLPTSLWPIRLSAVNSPEA